MLHRQSITLRKAIKSVRASRGMAAQAIAKKEGDISSVFSSLSGAAATPLDPRYATLKKQLIRGREEDLLASWRRLLKRLKEENLIVSEAKESIIPQIEFKDIASRPKEFEDKVKFRGVAVIQGVIPRDEAREYKNEVEEYVRRNPWTKAFPPHNPAVYELYWSPAQVKARAHAELIEAQKYLMSLWHSNDSQAIISTSNPLSYADRVRIRQPGDAGFALGPHVDGGSVERWEPNGYGLGHVYDSIFSGSWEEYDPWESSCRLPVATNLYNGAGGCSMFRMFQGWLSISDTGPNEGTLLVNPLLKLATAYFLLRPFMAPVRQPNVELSEQMDPGYLHEDNWVIEPDPTSTIQGAGPGLSQEMNSVLHPHLDLLNTMVHVPKIRPGDFVVWHCDTIHAVDKQHNGQTDSSVIYIPVCPLTENNSDYLVRQRETFVSGHPAPDFPGGKGESEHHDRPSMGFLWNHLGIDGLRAMGFAKFDSSLSSASETKMVEQANAALGFL